MDDATLARLFEAGSTWLAGGPEAVADKAWQAHPTCPGVSLKHLAEAKDCEGLLSAHLVRLEPDARIAEHVHAGKPELHVVLAGEGSCRFAGRDAAYAPGVCALIPADEPHVVQAGAAGLRLLAVFAPALR